MSTDPRARLARCFTAVFPDLQPAEVERASPQSVAAWDSVANVTLLSVVEEEFDVQIPIDDLEMLGSFELLLGYLRSELGVT